MNPKGQTIGKIIRRGKGVFVGLRDSIDPSGWFKGPLESISVQGVVFRGLIVPVDHPEAKDAAALAGGLGKAQAAFSGTMPTAGEGLIKLGQVSVSR